MIKKIKIYFKRQHFIPGNNAPEYDSDVRYADTVEIADKLNEIITKLNKHLYNPTPSDNPDPAVGEEEK